MSRLVAILILATAGPIPPGQGLYIHAKAMLAQVLLQRAFAESLATGGAVKPWPWADTWPEARIAVKRIGVSAIVKGVSSGQAFSLRPRPCRSAPPMPGNAALPSTPRIATLISAFWKDVAVGDEIEIANAATERLSLPRRRRLDRALRSIAASIRSRPTGS